MSMKNYLLQSVSQVLSECQRIVSILSQVEEDVNVEFCQDSSLWWEDEVVKKSSSSSCYSSFSELSEIKTTIENVVVDKFPSRLWWIPMENDVKTEGDETTVPDSDLNFSMCAENIQCSVVKTNVDALQSLTFFDPDEDGSIANGEECSTNYKHECNTRYKNQCHPVTEKKSSIKYKQQCQDVHDLFQTKLLQFMSQSCPAHFYDVNWREKKLRNVVPPDFFSIWTNFDLLTTNPAEDNDDKCYAAPVIRYPTIDFAKCNIRSIANVPKPGHFPVLGCSPDPNFYSAGKFNYSYPFGGKYGYKTNLGIVPVPDEPVHGYVWDGTDYDSDWVLCAVHPPDQRSEVSRKWQGFRKKG